MRALTTWLARRYTRPAFPDRFNARIDPTINKIKKKLRHADFSEAVGFIASVGFTVPEYGVELPSDEDYQLGITLIIDHRHLSAHQETFDAIKDFIEDLFDKCPGIAFFGVEVVDDNELTVAESRSLKLYDFDTLSLQGDDTELLLETEV
ncbi:MAG: hypothetical protein V7707_19670 [Motiliproteus sp.]